MRVDRRDIFVSLILFAATLAVFGQTCGHGFTNWDDPDYVFENQRVLSGLSRENARWAFTTFHAGNWHPLTWLSLQLDAQLFGPGSRAYHLANVLLHPVGAKPVSALSAAWGYHLTNVLLHAANAVLLFWLLRSMTGSLWRSLMVALFFAFHPLHVESVAWIAERKDVLSTFFLMAGCLAYSWYAGRPGWMKYLLTLAAFAAGLLAKPMLVTFPFVLLLLDYWPLGRGGARNLSRSGPEQGLWPPKRSATAKGSDTFSVGWLLLEKIPFLALAACSCLVTVYAQQQGHAIRSFERYPLSMRVGNALVTYCAYIGQLVWPANLGPFYPHPADFLVQQHQSGLPSWEVAGAVLVLALVSVLVCANGRTCPYLPVGWLWYLGTLVPVIGLVQVGVAGRADRYTYVPLIGLFIAGVWAVGDLASKWRIQKLAVGLSVFLVLAGVSLTWRQLSYWASDLMLWEHTLEACGPSTVAHTHFGIALLKLQNFDTAAEHFRATLRLDPNDPYALHDLGTALIGQGRIHEAVEQYRQAVRNHPHFDRPHYSLGLALADLGQRKEAIAEQEAALRLNPGFAAAHRALGILLSSEANFDEAAVHLRAAIEGGLVQPSVYYELARILALNEKFGEAVETLDRAVAIEPADWRLRSLLGLALYESGDHARAVAQYAEASRLNPGWPKILNQKAWILATHPDPQVRNGNQSIQLALQACQATANRNARYLDTLAAAYAEAGSFPRAVETAKQALAQAATEGNNNLAREIKEQLKLFEQRKAFRSTSVRVSQ
jgi:protein O-mannosyl-transferase